MKTISFFFVMIALIIQSCSNADRKTVPTEISYFETNDTTIQTGGVKMINIQTPKGNFNVWTKRIGNNPKIKVLLLHGGPEEHMNLSNALIVSSKKKELNIIITIS